MVGNPSGPETKNSYHSRLIDASIENQESWYDYEELIGNPPSGYPGYFYYHQGNTVYVPELTYQTGFVCYGLVYRAIISAGYNPFITLPLSVNALTNRLVGPTTEPQKGDIVAYDFDNDEIFDHMGIIVEMIGSSEKEWKVVSSIGIIEIFEYGAKKRRLGVFGSTGNGEFTVWNPQYENWTVKYFYVNTNQ